MNAQDVREQLARPFAVEHVRFFPLTVTRSEPRKGKVAVYADVRVYMDRLDEVLGSGGWSTSYRCIDPAEKAVECTLSLLIDGRWVSKADVGYPNDAKDADLPEREAWKAAYSDALKRAAVQHGVGRYLYRLELERDWLPVDDQGRFLEQPRIKGATAVESGRAAGQENEPTVARPATRRSFTAAELNRASFDRYGRPADKLTPAERREVLAGLGAGS